MKNFSFIKNRKIFFGISILVVVLGVASMLINGFNMDIDFVGGTEISYTLGQSITKAEETEIAEAVKNIIGAENFSSVRVSGNNDTITIRTLVIDNADTTDETSAAIEAKMAELYPAAVLTEESTATDKIYVLPDANTDDEEKPEWSEEDVAAVEAALAGADGISVEAFEDSLYVSFTSSSLVAKYRSDITEVITEMYENAAWQSTDTVSAEVSAGLKTSAILATSVAPLITRVTVMYPVNT